MTIIKLGSKVSWKGSWGHNEPVIAEVTGIELCEEKRMKYGTPVNEVNADIKDYCVFDLNTGNWCYGYQIEPIEI